MLLYFFFFFFTDTATTEIYTLSLHDALPISLHETVRVDVDVEHQVAARLHAAQPLPQHRLKRYIAARSEEHTSELQSRLHLVCRLLLEKKKHTQYHQGTPSVLAPDEQHYGAD